MSSVNLKRQKELNAEVSQVMDDFDRFEYGFVTHWKKIVAAAVLIVVAVTVFVSAKVYFNHCENKAAAALGQAQTAEALEKALAQYGSSAAAPAARLRLASLYVADKKYDGARREFQIVSGDRGASELAWRAVLNLACLAELEGKTEEAAQSFAAFSRTDAVGSEGYRAEALANAARLFLASGKKAEALKMLDEADALVGASANGPAAQAVAAFTPQFAFLRAQATAAAAPAKPAAPVAPAKPAAK